MARFLIEMTHGDDHYSCVMALHAIKEYGSHLLTRTDWGCRDGVHRGWFTAELGSREEAMQLVPPAFRAETRVVEVENFSLEEIANMVANLEK
jgi:hypothetical protein